MKQKLCTTHSNNYDELEEVIISSLTNICLNYINKDKIKNNVLNNLNANNKVNNKKELEILANDINQINDNLDIIYIDKLNKKITEEQFVRVKEKLEQGRKVLFTGNPCQIKALNTYLNKDYDNLYLVEILCHGVASPKVFRLYIKYLEEKYKSKVVDFKFRDKANGWGTGRGGTIKVKFENGQELSELGWHNNYNRAFANNNILRPVCYNCEFAGVNDLSDIVIGDFWGIEKIMPKFARKNNGISMIRINTDKGNELFGNINENLEYYKSNIKDAYRSNHKYATGLNENRFKLMEEVDGVEINSLLEKYNQFKTGKKASKKIKKESM